MEIMNYIQNNYADVTMDVLAENLDFPNRIFPNISRKIRYDIPGCSEGCADEKARRLLKESNQTVESIAASVGYENVEHFNRLFKRRMR